MKEDKGDESFFDMNSSKNISDYFTYLDNISKVLSKRLDELESENKMYKEEIEYLKKSLDEKDTTITRYKEQIDESEKKYSELTEKLEKEQRRSKVLEVENARNMDELKSLRKENKSLVQNSDSEKLPFIERIKRKFQ